MGITKYEGKTIERQSFVLEECFFINCVLKDCDLFYSGGDADWMNATFQDCRWHWRGPAAKTLQLMTTLGMLKQQGTPPTTASNTKLMN